jgi:hypothetical protein
MPDRCRHWVCVTRAACQQRTHGGLAKLHRETLITVTSSDDAAPLADQQTLLLQRLLDLFWPNATNVRVETVVQTPSQIQIAEYQADLPDGSTVYAPSIFINRGT